MHICLKKTNGARPERSIESPALAKDYKVTRKQSSFKQLSVEVALFKLHKAF
jgi:hypothetical protein